MGASTSSKQTVRHLSLSPMAPTYSRLRNTRGAALHPVLPAGHERAVRAMQCALGDAAFMAAWTEGQALPLEEAIARALEGHADAG